jgi:hypothetical protein
MAVAITATLTIVLFLYSLGLRVAHKWHDHDLAQIRKHWWPMIARAALSTTPDQHSDYTALSRGSRTKLLREWCRFRAQIKGTGGASLEFLADELKLRSLARRLLRRRPISNRLLAIQALGYLRDTRSWSALENLLPHPNISISITAATALVHINPNDAVSLIIPLISSRESWPRTQIGRILKLAGSDAVTGSLCHAIRKANCDSACRLFQFYESATINDIDSLAAELILTRTEPTLLAAALKSVRGQLPITMLEKLTRHKIWFVRMQAATVLGRSGRREDYRILEPLLSDTEWWVRYRAAQAIARLPFLGPNALRKLRDRQVDEYARDILHQALAEVGIV